LVLADKEITKKVSRKRIEYAFDLPRQLKNVDKIFARVFGNPSAKRGKILLARGPLALEAAAKRTRYIVYRLA